MKREPTREVASLSGVTFAYNGHQVLEGVDLDLEERDFAAIIGPNGGGKTTLMKILLGLLRPQRGQVLLFGEPPQRTAHRVGYVPQDIHANKHFPISALDVVLMGLLRPGRLFRRYSRDDHRAAEEALDQMEMWPERHKRMEELSGGQRQRVFIARALVSNPQALFLDEPTASVDAMGQTDLYSHLKRLNERITILVVTHDLMVLSSYVKSVICVNRSLIHHHAPEVTPDMLRLGYRCPVELLGHGHLPHRVLPCHGGPCCE
ncbi:zinc transport system ATP-binding protein [Desulfacinum hydrothermale DSM 13146]|uniref:Zinc transport system ATP-binding protein n=1 Tax=Desulfacinum hydrothermale DSM 13146 TaxID=1121390 RepID=A0A1W1XIC9_9BACT|nr:ABC transporter ATP-binding protein [Desulfacinum hydrothermale]SMC23720.1 zinc transport system ATP-binding protein [Desulfacinum hydrothermale DSM 13146]